MQNKQVKKSITALSLILGVSTLMVSVNSVAEQKVKPELPITDVKPELTIKKFNAEFEIREITSQKIIDYSFSNRKKRELLERRREAAEELKAHIKRMDQILIPQTKTVQGEMWIGQDKRVTRSLFKQINEDVKSRLSKLDAEYAPKYKAAGNDSQKSKELHLAYEHKRKQIYESAIELVSAALRGEPIYTKRLEFVSPESADHARSKHAYSKGLNPTSGPAGTQTNKMTKPDYSSLMPKSTSGQPPVTIVDGALDPERSFYDQVSTK